MTDNEAMKLAAKTLEAMVTISEALTVLPEGMLTELITAYLAAELQDVYDKGFSDGYGDGKNE